MRIEIRKRADKGYNVPVVYEVCVVDADERTTRMFTYPTIEAARRAARAWTVAYGNCPVVDRSGVKEERRRPDQILLHGDRRGLAGRASVG